MATKFADITADIMQNRKTGLLSLVIKNGQNHLKIFFAGGEIYHIVYGDLKDSQCLAGMEQIQVAECFFLRDVKLTAKDKFAVSTSEIIQRLKLLDKTVESQNIQKAAEVSKELSGILDKLKTALIRQIGPIGSIFFSDVLEAWRPPSNPTKQQLHGLVDLIQEKIESNEGKKEFIKECSTIIS